MVHEVDAETVKSNFYRFKQEAQELVRAEMERVEGDPALAGCVVRRKGNVSIIIFIGLIILFPDYYITLGMSSLCL